METKILNKVVNAFPREFFLQVEEQLNEAYLRARHNGVTLDGRPLYPYAVGHQRHVLRQEALKTAAELADLACRDVRPCGYPQVLVECADFRLTEIKVAHWGDLPKRSSQNLSLVEANPMVGASMPSLFNYEVGSEPLQGYIVIVNPKHSDTEGLPDKVGFGVPTANLDDWVILEPIEVILAAYTSIGSDEEQQHDRAVPRLRKIITEKKTEQE
ncbi:MAG: hypothetical protein OQK94_06180 [Gammaproteobacteria bacterium]|nr:hypothetical protein [Gammaproteobacteria bacterium]MCW8839853.1 hypothetical protein [Gammaproteobacteria bacterium]MCW8959072.1 hypothetical protein [Gammaproteobacteria bacterium]MCW8992574.1 hypothetical protein [Gammaproteobacteria bacterium]